MSQQPLLNLALTTKIGIIAIISGLINFTSPLQAYVQAYDFQPPNDNPCTEEDGCKDSGSRGDGELFVLIPSQKNINPEKLEQLTYQALPTFWIFVTIKEPRTVKFELAEETSPDNYQTTYETEFTLNKQRGIISFQLPENAPNLEPGKKYRWQFAVENENGNVENVEGLISRQPLPPEFNSELSPEQKMELYAANGIWFDLLTELAQLRRQNPDDPELKQKWDTLLQDPDVDLAKFKNQLLLDCCNN